VTELDDEVCVEENPDWTEGPLKTLTLAEYEEPLVKLEIWQVVAGAATVHVPAEAPNGSNASAVYCNNDVPPLLEGACQVTVRTPDALPALTATLRGADGAPYGVTCLDA
jgi:hypothetical protein